MNKVILEIDEKRYRYFLTTGLILPSHLKEIKIDDSFLKEDEHYQLLKKESNKAYKKVCEYRFKMLNNIK